MIKTAGLETRPGTVTGGLTIVVTEVGVTTADVVTETAAAVVTEIGMTIELRPLG